MPARQKKTDVSFLNGKRLRESAAASQLDDEVEECFGLRVPSPQTDKSHVYFTERKGDKEAIFEHGCL